MKQDALKEYCWKLANFLADIDWYSFSDCYSDQGETVEEMLEASAADNMELIAGGDADSVIDCLLEYADECEIPETMHEIMSLVDELRAILEKQAGDDLTIGEKADTIKKNVMGEKEMKKYFVRYGNFGNVYSLVWTEDEKTEKVVLSHGFERITRKQAEKLCALENYRRKHDSAFSGYASSVILPYDIDTDDAAYYLQYSGIGTKNGYIIE